jgi:hypothetical protein
VAVPQVRDGSFYPSALERGQRSERALTLALASIPYRTDDRAHFEVGNASLIRLSRGSG